MLKETSKIELSIQPVFSPHARLPYYRLQMTERQESTVLRKLIGAGQYAPDPSREQVDHINRTGTSGDFSIVCCSNEDPDDSGHLLLVGKRG